MKFLVDTNIVIRAEPTSPADVEAGTPIAIEFLRLIAKGSHQAYLHPASLEELRGDREETRRSLRETLVRKYPELPSPPVVPLALEAILGRPDPSSHDRVDHLLLAAVSADAVDYLVTDDHRIVRRARRVDLASRVLTPADAVATLRRLFQTVPTPPPAVAQVYAHELDDADPIFDSFRSDYPDFQLWIRKCKREHRISWIIPAANGQLAALCIVKAETNREHGLPGRLLKLCSFKVSDDARGFRYGELLLKAVFTFAFENWYDHVYVEVFPKYSELIDLLDTFGFQELPARTLKGEIVLGKPLSFSQREFETLDALQFHIRFGPKYLKAKDVFVVPIRPEYHDMLFPEHAVQPELFGQVRPFGNGILKAYLCHSPSRQLTPGSVLLFYESGGSSQVRCVGVVEETLVASQPDRVARFVGQRTVYSLAEIKAMCVEPVLAILFRQASGLLNYPLPLRDLLEEGVLTTAPRSITRVKAEGLRWMRDQIELSP